MEIEGLRGAGAYGFQLRMFKSGHVFNGKKTIFSTIQFYLTHICTEEHSAHIGSIKWNYQEMS